MARTTAALVRGVLQRDYRIGADVAPYIRAANLVVTRVNTCATAKSITLSSDELTEVETWLAAHFYVCSEQTLASKSGGGAGGSFHGQTGMHLDSSRYGQTAQTIDYSGCLAAIGKRQFASMEWLGLAPSDQTDYDQRD